MDCDIVLPHRFRKLLNVAELSADTIYGIDRFLVKSWDDWKKIKDSQFMQGGGLDYNCRSSVTTNNLEVGTRWVHPEFGYVPIGFFQLFHSSQDEWKGIRVKNYPSSHNSACRTDVQFGLKWDRDKRAIIPEIVACHLESEPALKGANWNGRCTKWFGPEIHTGQNYSKNFGNGSG